MQIKQYAYNRNKQNHNNPRKGSYRTPIFANDDCNDSDNREQINGHNNRIDDRTGRHPMLV